MNRVCVLSDFVMFMRFTSLSVGRQENDPIRIKAQESLRQFDAGCRQLMADSGLRTYKRETVLRDIGMDYAQGFAIGKPLESLERNDDPAPVPE